MFLNFQLQVLIEVPFVLFQACYYSLIVYAMVSFEWKVEKFFWFVFVSFFSFLYFTYYGMMTVSITPNHQVASIFAAAFYGLFIPRPVSTILVWLFYSILQHISVRINLTQYLKKITTIQFYCISRFFYRHCMKHVCYKFI
jgi:hypothetical protein